MVSIRSITIQTSPVFLETSYQLKSTRTMQNFNDEWSLVRLQNWILIIFFVYFVTHIWMLMMVLHLMLLQSCFMLIFTNALLSMHEIPFIWDLTFVVFTHSSLNNSLLFSAMMSLCRARIRTSGASWWQSGPRGQREEYQDKRWQRGNTSLAINLQCC